MIQQTRRNITLRNSSSVVAYYCYKYIAVGKDKHFEFLYASRKYLHIY